MIPEISGTVLSAANAEHVVSIVADRATPNMIIVTRDLLINGALFVED
jgi:hypothetical protein